VHELGHRAGADRADIAGLVADRVEHLFVPVEDLLVAADPQRQPAGGGAARPAADRRVEHVDMLLGKAAVDLAHQGRRIGRQVEIGAAVLHAGEQAVCPERDLLDLGRAGQRGEDDLALLGERLRAVGPDRAGGEVALGGGAPDVVDDELVPGLLQIGRHAGAHRAEPDKTDFHVSRLTPLSPGLRGNG
jgi:hypothetical protein